MRLSTSKADPGFHNWRKAMGDKVVVKLNGEIVDRAVTADTVSGYVKRMKTDENGRLYIDRRTNDVATEWFLGNVDIYINGFSVEGGGGVKL